MEAFSAVSFFCFSWAKLPLFEVRVAVAWGTVRAMADQIFMPPWKLFLRKNCDHSELSCHSMKALLL